MQSTPKCKRETLLRVVLGLNIYNMGNRPITMGYLIKFSEGPYQTGLKISLIL